MTVLVREMNEQLTDTFFAIVVGADEQESRTVNIRNRDDPATQKQGALIPLDEALQKLKDLRDERKLISKIEM